MSLLPHSPVSVGLLPHSPVSVSLLPHSPVSVGLLPHSPVSVSLLPHSPVSVSLLPHSPVSVGTSCPTCPFPAVHLDIWRYLTESLNALPSFQPPLIASSLAVLQSYYTEGALSRLLCTANILLPATATLARQLYSTAEFFR